MEATDFMKVSFYNTEFVLNPEKPDKLPIPNGYTVVIKMPP